MKKLMVFLLSALSFLSLAAQNGQKNDVVLKINGDELNGKVSEIADTDIKFTYAGETLVYTIKKADVLKITYASGRVEFFNKQPLPSETQGQPAQAAPSTVVKDPAANRNKVAILPFGFIRDRQDGSVEMSYEIQNECYNFLSKHSGELTLLDPRTTNALLIKAGATQDKIRGFGMDELCGILGVEYIIEGTVAQTKTDQHSTSNDTYKASSSDNKGKNDTKVSGTSYASTTQNYQTSMTVNVYTDKNASVFSDSRQSFWNTENAYKNALEYLLKRTPLYRK